MARKTSDELYEQLALFEENSKKRHAVTVKAVKASTDRVTENSDKNHEKTRKEINEAQEKVCEKLDEAKDEIVDSMSGEDAAPLSAAQWLGAIFIGLVAGLLGFWFYMAGANNGVFLCTSRWKPVYDAAGNYMDKIAVYEPWMVAIWIFTIATAILGAAVAVWAFSSYNARHAED